MRQYVFSYQDDESLISDLSSLKDQEGIFLFHLYSTAVDADLLNRITTLIERMFPNSLIAGATANAVVSHGSIASEPVQIVCSIFTYGSTKIEVMHYPIQNGRISETSEHLTAEVNAKPWVKAVELLLPIRGISLTSFCNEISDIRDQVEIFGGGAFADDINNNEALTVTNDGAGKDLTAVLYGGEDLHVQTGIVSGWKPLGRKMLVTRADSHGRLYELDHRPAYDVYNHYLRIPNDASFFRNTLEFPFLYDDRGISILRAPVSCADDGSLEMTSNMEEGRYARIAFGDPDSILSQVDEAAEKISDFQPQTLTLITCAARKFFWGEKAADQETEPFESLAPSTGFYSSSEFLRQNSRLRQYNVTLVIAAFREGPLTEKKTTYVPLRRRAKGMSIVERLASFVEVSNAELEESNAKLQEQNMVDGMTGLFNRVEIQKRISAQSDLFHRLLKMNITLKRSTDATSLIMLDIDFFKRVNDSWGHEEGDQVLKRLATYLRNETFNSYPNASVGRWGGEEFMILMPGTSVDEARRYAEKIRQAFANFEYEKASKQTVSIGVTNMDPAESADETTSRVDHALYKAKKSGRNCTVLELSGKSDMDQE